MQKRKISKKTRKNKLRLSKKLKYGRGLKSLVTKLSKRLHPKRTRRQYVQARQQWLNKNRARELQDLIEKHPDFGKKKSYKSSSRKSPSRRNTK